MVGRRWGDNPQYASPVALEIVGLIVGDFGMYDKNRDIVVEFRDGKL